jgi:hypothetical protein
MSTTPMRQKLLSLITVRAAVVSLLLGSAVVIQIKSPGSIPIGWVSLLIGVTFGLTAVYSLTVRQAEKHRWLIGLQLLVDALIVSAIVYVTGGINSYFLVALRAADHRHERDPIVAGRHDRRHCQLEPVCHDRDGGRRSRWNRHEIHRASQRA